MEDRCVCCGSVIPEGELICWQCKHEVLSKEVTQYEDARSCERIDEACR